MKTVLVPAGLSPVSFDEEKNWFFWTVNFRPGSNSLYCTLSCRISVLRSDPVVVTYLICTRLLTWRFLSFSHACRWLCKVVLCVMPVDVGFISA